MVSLSKLLTSGFVFAPQAQFRDVASPELTSKQQCNTVRYLAAAGPFIQGSGFGISTETPDQCTVEQVQLFMRHGERFPGLAAGKEHKKVVEKLQSYHGTFKGELSFLNDYVYYVPNEDLYELETTPWNSIGPYNGYETSLRAGAAFRAKYNHLYDESEKLPLFIAASKRVYDTALYFANGFLGESYSEDKINKVVVNEDKSFGLNSLAPRWGCTAYNGSANNDFVMDRFTTANPGLDITNSDISSLFQICAYETNSRGYSPFCDIFTQDEFVTYGYANDLAFYYSSGPGGHNSVTAGAVQFNATMALLKDNSAKNKIWLTFSHDTDIELFSSALGLFDTLEPLPNAQVRVRDAYHHVDVIPMGGRFITEKLSCENDTFVRFIVSDAVIPVKGCADGPGFSCRLDKFEDYIKGRIGDIDISEDCKVPEGVPDKLTFYWDYTEVNYNATAERITA
ncbi:acid phosphatase [Scheffersomyces xylosifermentans]|uniref:acid phosphatase n=1 Tax=Scheffersomyces xylosifermentans TaxID=1304137 RepID=UPI00315DB245